MIVVTERSYRYAELVLAGWGEAAIAERLSFGDRAARKARHELRDRLGVTSLELAVFRARLCARGIADVTISPQSDPMPKAAPTGRKRSVAAGLSCAARRLQVVEDNAGWPESGKPFELPAGYFAGQDHPDADKCGRPVLIRAPGGSLL